MQDGALRGTMQAPKQIYIRAVHTRRTGRLGGYTTRGLRIWGIQGSVVRDCVGTGGHRLDTALETVVKHTETVNTLSDFLSSHDLEEKFTVSSAIHNGF